jgi:molybdate transport system substrate-binding protein
MKVAARLLIIMACSSGANAADALTVYSAGSLRGPLVEMGRDFELKTGTAVKFEFGASGLLKDRIIAGAPAMVFASANTEHPEALAKSGKASPMRVFTHNQLCALVGPKVDTSSQRLLSTLLDERVKVATSTPKADPSGDYAWEVFQKADKVRSGSFNILSQKALQLVGGPNSAPAPEGRTVYATALIDGKADIFLTYCTNAALAMKESSQLKTIELPTELAVGASYGVTVLHGSPNAAERFVAYMLGSDGQRTLQRYGFR